MSYANVGTSEVTDVSTEVDLYEYFYDILQFSQQKKSAHGNIHYKNISLYTSLQFWWLIIIYKCKIATLTRPWWAQVLRQHLAG